MKFKKLITLASLVGLIVFLATTVVACTSKSEKTDTKTEQTSSQKDKDKDKELKEALNKAKSYDKSLKTSYDDLRLKLLEEDFSDEAINYALSNAGIDWKQNALEKAKDYAKNDNLSRSMTEFKLQNYDGFEPEEVKYAVENSGINWK